MPVPILGMSWPLRQLEWKVQYGRQILRTHNTPTTQDGCAWSGHIELYFMLIIQMYVLYILYIPSSNRAYIFVFILLYRAVMSCMCAHRAGVTSRSFKEIVMQSPCLHSFIDYDRHLWSQWAQGLQWKSFFNFLTVRFLTSETCRRTYTSSLRWPGSSRPHMVSPL